MHDLISRQAAIDAIKGLPTWWADEGGYYGGAKPPMEALLDPEDTVSAIENLPSAQPEPHYDEWCDDCKEYDKERHCCPRWNRVIRETLKDAQPNTDHIYAELSKAYNVPGLPEEAIGIIGDLMVSLDEPSAQPNLDRKNVSDLMEKIYSIQSPHLSTEGVIAKKYYCKQLWIELFGSEDVPTWID